MNFSRNQVFRVAMLAGMVLGGTASAEAAVRNKACPNCSESTMYNTARAAGLGEIYIYDPYANGLMRKYRTFCGSIDAAPADPKDATKSDSARPDAGICGVAPMTTEEIPVEPAYVELAPNLAVAWVVSGGTFVFGTNMPLDASAKVAASGKAERRGFPVFIDRKAWPDYYPKVPTINDFITDYNFRAQVQDYVSQHGLDASTSSFRAVMTYLFSHADAALNFTGGITITFEVTFSDGATLVYTQALNQPALYLKNSSRDGTGRGLPEGNASEYAGTWRYPTSEDRFWNNLLSLLDRLNVNVDRQNPANRTMRCTWDGQRNTLTCVVSP